MLEYTLPDGTTYSLNRSLILQNNVSPTQIEDLKTTYIQKYHIFEKMKKCVGTQEMFPHVASLEHCENCLQDLWNFDVDRNFHCYWHVVPFCTCDSAANRKVYAQGIRIENPGCPLHGLHHMGTAIDLG